VSSSCEVDKYFTATASSSSASKAKKKKTKPKRTKQNETTKELAATPAGGLYRNNKNLLFSNLQLDPNTPPINKSINNSKKILG
jgi:hypothetical protein